MSQTYKIGNDEYEVIPPAATTASKVIADMYERLGKPTDPFSKSGAQLVDIIIAVWQDLWPKEAQEWLEARKEYRNNEMTTREQVAKGTGRSLASYPYPVYKLFKKVFPKFDPTERKNCMKMVRKWPMFQMANEV